VVVEINISIVEKNVLITVRFFDNHYKGRFKTSRGIYRKGSSEKNDLCPGILNFHIERQDTKMMRLMPYRSS
jgi:hypothetical protein